jgi:aminomethyltransferase
VVNAATRAKVLAWLQAQLPVFRGLPERPIWRSWPSRGRTPAKVAALLSPARALIRELRPFEGVADGDWFIARTGYTGEDGLEIIFPGDQAVAFFNDLVGAGIAPSGLGARDTLRLEAGMNLYGQDIDENHTR